MFKKLISFFTPTKWETVWSKPINGWSSGIFGKTQRNMPLLVKLQMSEKEYRFILSDGVAKNKVDADYVISHITGAKDALIANNCKI